MSLTKTTRWREYDVHVNAFSCYSVDSLFPCRLLLLLCFDSIVLVCSKLLFHRQTVANARSKNATAPCTSDLLEDNGRHQICR